MGYKKSRQKNLPDFAQRLGKAMRVQMMSIKELADIAGVTYEMARRYAAGKGMPRDQKKLEQIATALRVDLDWLVSGEGPDLTPQKKQPLVPVFDLGSKKLSFSNKKWKGHQCLPAPYADFKGIAVEVAVPLGCVAHCGGFSFFKQGDILFVSPPDDRKIKTDDVVLVEAKRKTGQRYFVRKVKHSHKGMSFISTDPKNFPDLHLGDYDVFGVVTYLSAKIEH